MIVNSQISMMLNSTFTKNGGESKERGGAFSMMDSTMIITDSTFDSNTAMKGGAIAFE